MLFSIIIPSYNYASRITCAIESALNQKGDDFEIIVMDDGSTDDTREKVSYYCDLHKGVVKYFFQENKGPSVARNNGVKQSMGEYLLFLDADDQLLHNALDLFRDFIQKSPQTDFIFGGHVSVYADGMKKKHNAPALSRNNEKNFIEFLRKKIGSISHGSVIMKRHIFDKLKYPCDIRNNEDIVLFSHILLLYNCASFQEPVVNIFKYKDSLRHNLEMIRLAGTRVTDLIFNSDLLPPHLMNRRDEFYSKRCLSQFRVLFLAGYYKEAKAMYHRAMAVYPKNLFKISYFKKYLKTQIYVLMFWLQT
jgi:glycosyltransferase involved in cell wall biosynthesis